MPRHATALICTAALLLCAGCATSVSATAGTPTPVALAPRAATSAPDGTRSGSLTPRTEAPPTPAEPTSPSAAPGGTGSRAGWKTVRSTRRAALYDVPPDWTVNSEDTIVGFGTRDGQVLVAGSGSASVGENACGERTTLATSVVKHSTSTDLATTSRLEAQRWADLGFLDAEDRRPTLRTGKPETITTVSGKRAVVVKVTATAASSIGGCGPQGAAYAVSATGFTGELGPTAIVVVVAAAGVPIAVPDDRIRQMLTTLRPAS